MYRYYKVLDTGEISRIHLQGKDKGLLETYNNKTKKWEIDRDKIRMFIGEIDVDVINEEEANRLIKEGI